MKKYFAGLALVLALMVPASSRSQVVVELQSPVVVAHDSVQPVCQYGYYDYSPYACADEGFYGSGYFYNGVFLGVGPWYGYGYAHGWGGHRFTNGRGGRYSGNVRQSSRGRSEQRSQVRRSQSRGSRGKR